MTPSTDKATAVLPRWNASRGASSPSPGTSPLPTASAATCPRPSGRGLSSQRMVALSLAHAAIRQPVAAHGWWWPSQKDASAEMGVKDYVVTRALQRGKFDALVMQRLGVKP